MGSLDGPSSGAGNREAHICIHIFLVIFAGKNWGFQDEEKINTASFFPFI